MLIDQTAGVEHHLALIRGEHHGRSLYFHGIPGPGREIVGALIRFECFDESLCETDGWIAHIGFPPVAVGKHNAFNGRELGPLHPCPRLDSVPAHDIRPGDSGSVSKFDRIEDTHIRFIAGWYHRRNPVPLRVEQLSDSLGRAQINFMTQRAHGRRLLKHDGRIPKTPDHTTFPPDRSAPTRSQTCHMPRGRKDTRYLTQGAQWPNRTWPCCLATTHLNHTPILAKRVAVVRPFRTSASRTVTGHVNGCLRSGQLSGFIAWA